MYALMIFTNKVPALALSALLFITIVLGSVAFARRVGAGPELYFLNVGQGDSEFIQLAGGAQILIDGGPDGRRLLENLAKVISPQDRYIDLLIMTHPQADHMVGFIEVLKKYEVGAFIGNLRKAPIAAYGELHKQLELHKAPYIQLVLGDEIKIGDTALHILSPSRQNIVNKELNDTSVVVLLDSPQIKALYTGDIGMNIEDELVRRYGKALDVDVLKVAHHGSRFSSGLPFLRATTPAIAVIEVGKNTYGHPTKQAIGNLIKVGARVLRTDEKGIIKIAEKKGGLQIFNYR